MKTKKNSKLPFVLEDLNLRSIIIEKKKAEKAKIIPIKVPKIIEHKKYFPPSTNEWSNSIYVHYKNNHIKSLPVLDKNLFKLIKSYFNFYVFAENKIIYEQHAKKKYRRVSLNQIFLNKPELEHTNSKVIINIHLYNLQEKRLHNTIIMINDAISFWNKQLQLNKKVLILKNKFKLQRNEIFKFFRVNTKEIQKNILSKGNNYLFEIINKFTHEKINKFKPEQDKIFKKFFKKLFNKYKYTCKIVNNRFFNIYKQLLSIKNPKIFNKILINELLNIFEILYRNKVYIPRLENLSRFIYMRWVNMVDYNKYYKKYCSYYNLKGSLPFFYSMIKYLYTEYKFKKGIHILSGLIFSIYNKKVEFNIVFLKQMYLNSNMLTQAISLKLRNRNNRVWNVLSSCLGMVNMPKPFNKFKEKKLLEVESLVYKVKKLDIYSIISFAKEEKNFDTVLLTDSKKIINKDYLNILITRIIPSFLPMGDFDKWSFFLKNCLKYKTIRGIKLEGKGRLTKRYRADRALFKVQLLGGLKNIDSSYKGLSTKMLRGHVESNVQYSLTNSNNRLGAYGVKGWVSGK